MKLTNKIQKAINLAAELHFGQTRRGGNLPYVVHPFSVAWIVVNYTDDEDIICACLLHDILEDVDSSKYNEEDMMNDFGERVLKIVKGVSEDKNSGDKNNKKKRSWQERKLAYIEGLKKHNKASLIVSCADKIHNLQSLIDLHKEKGDSLWDNFNAPEPKKEKSFWFYEKILEVLKERLDNKIVLEYEILLRKAKDILN